MALTQKDFEIENIASRDPGYLLTKEITEAGIPRIYLTDYLIRHPNYERLERGVYVDTSVVTPDNFYILSLHKSAVFSYFSALHLLGVTENKVQPNIFDITLPAGYNKGRVQGKNTGKNRFVEGENLRVHFTPRSKMQLGLETVKTQLGHNVPCFCAERSICEIEKHRKYFDEMQYHLAIRSFFGWEKMNTSRLLEFASEFNVFPAIWDYLNTIDSRKPVK